MVLAYHAKVVGAAQGGLGRFVAHAARGGLHEAEHGGWGVGERGGCRFKLQQPYEVVVLEVVEKIVDLVHL